MEEIRMDIIKMKSGKATGFDNIPAEALNLDIEVTAIMLHVQFKKIWEETLVLPTDWKEGYHFKIPKK
ncbi:unnamed protein product [Schistosoma margrebowiei]|uniref:Uncharacterized protein n=1 Tax=Schistosoma margrebowiei TaxID=48269 RepID=A0A183MUC2_9TREM|nr:unnamed protein product [Schistosoma margrebowiei]